ncbi:MAG TPA: hypothetical protein VLX92_16500 [Kofleriaceae bacterium]|nr:hypothetical protein [Kofleriaceae bacterium]
MEFVRLRGIARRIGNTTQGPLAGNCELAVRQKRQRHVVDGKFELVEDDGKTSVIEIAGAAVYGEDEKRTTYGQIADQPEVSAIGLRPEPNVPVTLKSAWILEGKPVEIVGTRDDTVIKAVAAGSQQALDAWQAMRAKEDDKRKVTHRRTPMPWGVIVPTFLLILTLVIAEASVTLGASIFTYVAPSIAITIAAIAVGLLWEQVRLPKFDEREKKRTGLFATLAVVIGIGVNLPPEGPLGTAIVGTIVLAVGVFGLIHERRMVGLARRLVAPPSEPTEGKPGVFVGRVSDNTPAQFFSQLIAIGAVHTVRKRRAATEPRVIDTEKLGFDTTFQLSLPDRDIEIDPRDATWSSEHRNKHQTWSVFLPVDAAVVAAGTPVKADGKLCLRSSGRDTLVLYGVPGSDDPQDSLRRKLLLHKLTYGAMFMVVTLAGALAVNGYLRTR